jgi:hypothetical protein
VWQVDRPHRPSLRGRHQAQRGRGAVPRAPPRSSAQEQSHGQGQVDEQRVGGQGNQGNGGQGSQGPQARQQAQKQKPP